MPCLQSIQGTFQCLGYYKLRKNTQNIRVGFMKSLKNEFGVSLIELTVGLGIAAAAGVAYMTHMQTVSKNEALLKARQAITHLEMQATEYMSSQGVCSTNLANAFRDLAIVPDSDGRVKGKLGYKTIMNKGFINENQELIQRNIFTVGDLFEGGRVYVSNVSYEVADLNSVSEGPWNRIGKLRIKVDFDRCRNGAAVYHEAENKVLVEVCPVANRITSSKTFEKYAAFKVGGNNKVLTEEVNGDQKEQLICANTEAEAAAESSQEYVDIKACATEAKMLMLTGRMGILECGLQVSMTDQSKEYGVRGSYSFNIPSGFVPGSFTAEIVGGGGGGGGGRGGVVGKSGFGGGPGEYKSEVFNSAQPGQVCSIVVGRGGNGGSSKNNGIQGTFSELRCPAGFIRANGGMGGRGEEGNDNCGTQGKPSMNPQSNSVIGYGSAGKCKNNGNTAPGLAGVGAGGGGGGKQNYVEGRNGGEGLVRMKWKGITLVDHKNVLTKIGTSVDKLVASLAMEDKSGSNVCVDGGWSDWVTVGDCMGDQKYEQRQCNNPSPTSCGKYCEGPNTRTMSCNCTEGDLACNNVNKD
jgi:hypothetical protein